MLLTCFKQVRCSVKQCCITHSLSMRDRVEKSACHDRPTYLLFVIQCSIGSFTKNQNWVMSLTFCRLWEKIADHKGKHYSQTVVMRQCITSVVVQCHSPTDTNIIRSSQQEYDDINLWFTQLTIGLLKHDWCCVHVKAFEHHLPPDQFSWVFIIPYDGHLPLCPPITI